jgi:hypothetical protein
MAWRRVQGFFETRSGIFQSSLEGIFMARPRRSSVSRSQELDQDQDQVFPSRLKLHQEVALSSIRPSSQNEALYRPVSAKDPEIIALADSIRKYGLRDSWSNIEGVSPR